MRKSWAVLLVMILALASVTSSAQKIEDIPWDESHIKTLRALGKLAAFRFFIRQEDPDNEMEFTESSLGFGFDWYPSGDRKYELAINSQSGPDIAHWTSIGGTRRESSDRRTSAF